MAFIRTASVEDAEGDLATEYQRATDRSRLNAVRVQSANPATLTASAAFHDALFHGDSPLSQAERLMIAVVVSSANNSRYGTASHAQELRKHVDDEVLVTALMRDYRAARVDQRIRNILDG